MRKVYPLPTPEEMFPSVEVSGMALASWKDSPMTAAFLSAVHRKIYSLSSDLYRDDEDKFHERKGRIAALKDLLGMLETMESEILARKAGPADEDDEE